MSRTDKQSPYWVKLLDPAWRHVFYEVHNHEKKPCNITEVDYRGRIDYNRCYLNSKSIGKNIHCGCKMCSGQDGRRQERRGERHLAKKILLSGKWEDGIPKYTGGRW